jgi:hypothetical protein
MIAVRCLSCSVLFTTIDAYTYPTHLCSGQTRDTANGSSTVEQTTTALPAPLSGDAVVIPLFRRPLQGRRPVEPRPA